MRTRITFAVLAALALAFVGVSTTPATAASSGYGYYTSAYAVSAIEGLSAQCQRELADAAAAGTTDPALLNFIACGCIAEINWIAKECRPNARDYYTYSNGNWHFDAWGYRHALNKYIPVQRAALAEIEAIEAALAAAIGDDMMDDDDM